MRSLRGRGAVGEFLFARLKHDPGLWSFKMKDGSVMTVPRGAEMSWIPAFTGAYDPAQLELILRFLSPNSFVLDVGACFGFYAVPMGKAAAARQAQVIAFEALSSNQRLLQNNVTQNGLQSVVTSLPIALGREPATVEMLVEGAGTGNAFIRTSGFQEKIDARSVATNIHIDRLDALPLYRWTSKSKCSLIKMDIEGFELEALAGGEAFVAKHRPVIFGEFNPWFQERHGIAADAPIEWALAHRYLCFDLLRSRTRFFSDKVTLKPVLLNRGASRSGGDMLMIPSENPALVGRLFPEASQQRRGAGSSPLPSHVPESSQR
jgi:FkbM family methyltransferase